MAREQEDAMSTSPARGPRPDTTAVGAETAASTEGASADASGPGAITASLHRNMGNAVVHAALAGDSVGPMGSLVASSVMMDAVGVGAAADFGANSAAMRTMGMRSVASEGLNPDKADLSALKGGGKPLPEEVRDRMERAFEEDFSKVRIHTDAGANKASKAFNALAMTLGYDIFFKENVGNFKEKKNQKLLAHELTHVQQHIQGKIGQQQGNFSKRSQAQRFGMGDLMDQMPGMDEVQSMLGGGGGGGMGIEVSEPTDALEQEAYGNEQGILKKLDKIDKMFDIEGQMAKVVGQEPGQLLQMFEQAAGGQLTPEVAEQLFKALGSAVKGADPQPLHDIESSIGKGLVGLAQSLMPEDLVETESRNGAPQSVDEMMAGTAKGRKEGSGADPETNEGKGEQVANKAMGLLGSPIQVARSVFKDKLTPGSWMAGTGVQEIQSVSGGSFEARRPLRTILDSRHGAIADQKYQPVIDAMTQAMSSADAFGYDQGRILDAGAGKLADNIGGAPERDRTRTALKMARQGSNISLPYKQRLLQDLRNLLDDGEGGIDSTMLDNINVYVSDPSCRSLSAEAYAIGNLVVFKDSAPSYEVVKEEVTHVIQQGGHLSSLQSIPSTVPMTKPTDAVEVEARGVAGTNKAPDVVADSGIQIARSISIGETQGEVFQAVVQGAIPDGYSEMMNTWVGEGDSIQAGEDAVKGIVNASQAFPLEKVDALFSGDQFGVLDPNSFQESLKNSNDNIVQEVVDLVMGICDKALSVLDGIIGIVTEIMNVVESFVQLLESISNAMQVFGAILIGIGTGLCFVIIPAGIGSQFIQWGNDLLNIGQKAQNLADQVKKIIEPLQEAIDKIEQVKEKIEQVREICGVIQECLDVYEWFMSDTSNERLTSAENLNESGERASELEGQLTGGKYQEFATKMWEGSLPVIDYVLEGEDKVDPVNEQSTPAPLGFSVPGVSESNPAANDDPSGVQEAFAQKKGERTGEGSDVYSDIVEPISWPSFFKPKPSDGIKVVTNFIGGGSPGDAGMPGAPTHTHPGQTQGGGPGSGSSVVSGAMGEVGDLSQTPLNTESLVMDAVEFTQHALDLGGYPSDIAETFDYLNNVIQYQETSASLETQGSQRMEESRNLQENAQNSITAAQNIIDISDDQEEAAADNEQQGHEGVSFTDYLMNLSQDLQAELQDRMAKMMEGMNLTDQASEQAMQSEMNAESGMEQGNQLAMSGSSIAAMLAQALIQVILQQAMQQILSGNFLKEMIPGDLQKVLELGTTFLDTAQGAFDRAVQKENESREAQATYNQSISTDQATQALAQQTRSNAEQMKATAEETLAKAEQGEADATELRERARTLDRNLKSEQSNAESGTQQRLSEAGPMRPRVTPEYVDAPTDWDGVSVDNPGAKAPGSTVTNVGPLPVSQDMGHPHPVSGPVPTELIQATPLPFVVSNIFKATLDAYRQFGNPNVTVGAPKQPTMEVPTAQIIPGSDHDQQVKEEVEPILVGGEGGGSYDPAYVAEKPPEASDSELVTERDLQPDLTMTLSGIEKRAEDPQPPFTPEAQRAQLSQPASDALIDQEADRADQIREAEGLIPTAEYIYHTIPPLPSMLPPQPEFQDLKPMDVSGLGYNAQQILIDGDIAAIQGWIGTLPTEVKLLGPGVSDNLTMPQIDKPEVQTASDLPVPEYPELKLNPVPSLDAPQFPVHDVLRENPERFNKNKDVDHPSMLLRDAYDEVLDRVNEKADAHEEEEQATIDSAQAEAVAAQDEQQQAMDAALTKRDQVFRSIRDWMESSQNDAIRQFEAGAKAREDQHFDEMQRLLDDGRLTADEIMREGERIAYELEAKATADATRINSEAMTKALTLWGWFRTEASVFTANIATMLTQLWNSANTAVELTLVGAHTDAMATLYVASDAATQQLDTLGKIIPPMYAESRQQLGSIGQEGQQKLREAIDECVAEMVQAANTASQTVTTITETTKQTLGELRGRTTEEIDAEWTTFDEMAEKLREAKQVPPVRIEEPTPGEDVQEPVPSHPDEQRSFREDDGDQPSADPQSEQVASNEYPDPEPRTPQPIEQATELKGQYENFKVAQPTQKADNYQDLSSSMTTAHQAEEQAFQATVEPLDGRLSGDTPEANQAVASPDKALDVGSEGSDPTVQIDPTPAPSTEPVSQTPQITSWEEPAPEMDAVPNAEQVSERFNEIPTHDESIVTSPGPAPVVPATGSADPRRLNHIIGQGLGTAEDATLDAQQSVLDSPQADRIVKPRQKDYEQLAEPLQGAGTLEDIGSVEGMDKYVDLGLPGDVTAEFDNMYGPEMEANLEAPQGELDQAIQQRDQDREQAISDAHAEAHAKSLELQGEQASVVDEQRQAITDKRQETMQAQADAMAEFSTKAKAEHAKQFRATQEKINSTQTQVNAKFVEAQREAERKVIEGEQQAAAEKEAAEKDANDKKWWEFARDWIADKLKSLSDAINSIFDAVRQAVVDIIDAAKDFAKRVIEEAISFVKQAINLYAEFLKAEIELLVGTFFPQLAKELTEFVDEAVATANDLLDQVEQMLEEFIDSLAQKLKDGLDTILLALEGLVDLTLGTTYGVLTGDWMQAIKMAFDAVLKLAGIPPGDFYSVLSQAENVLQFIMKNPGTFVSSSIDAGGQGFGQFASNFLEHLKNGFLEWATDKALEFGLKLAGEKFNPKGMFSAAADKGGVDMDYLKDRTQQLAGEENVARFADAWQKVEEQVGGQVVNLYESVKDKVNPVYQTVKETIQNWLLTQIAQKAAQKFISLFVPGGALVQAVMTGWDVFMWFREKMQAIFSVVQAVIGNAQAIALGNISAAADGIEAALASVIPLAIDLLAQVLGLKSGDDQPDKETEKAVSPVKQGIDQFLGSLVDEFDPDEYVGMHDSKSGDNPQQFVDEQSQDHEMWMEADGTTHLASTEGRYTEHTSRETHDFYYLSDGDKAQLTEWGVLTEEGVVAGKGGDWQAVMDAADKLNEAAGQLPGMELPATPHIEEKDAEAEGKKDDGTKAEGENPGNSQEDADKAQADGGNVDANADAAQTEGVDAAQLPTELDDFMKVGEAIGWFDEMSKLEWFTDDLGAGVDAVPPKLTPSPDRWQMLSEALGQGALQGLKEGAFSIVVDTAINAASSKIPYLAGFIEVFQFAMDPLEYGKSVLDGLGGKGKYAQAFARFKSGDPIEIFTGVLDLFDGVKETISTLSKICWLVAGLGFIASLFWPALLPFVALAAKWGVVFGTVSTVIGLGLTALRAVVIALQSAKLLYGDADPEELLATQQTIRDQTQTFVKTWVERKGDKIRDNVQTRRQKADTGEPPKASDNGAPEQKPNKLVEALKFASPLNKGMFESAGDNMKSLRVKDLAKVSWDLKGGHPFQPVDGETLMKLEGAGVPVFANDKHRDFVDQAMQKHGKNDTQEYQRAHEEYDRAKADYDQKAETAHTQAQKVREAQTAYNKAREATDAVRGTPEALSAADNEVKLARDLVNEYDAAPAQAKAKAADDVARRLEYESKLAPGDPNKRLAAQDARQFATEMQTEADTIADNQRAAQQLLGEAETHRNDLAAAQKAKEDAAEEFERGEGLKLEEAEGNKDSVFSHLADGAEKISDAEDGVLKVRTWAEGEEAYQRRNDELNANPGHTNYTGGPSTIHGQNLGSGKTGSLTGVMVDATKDHTGLLDQQELDMEMQENQYIESLQELADTIGTAEAKPKEDDLSQFASEPSEELKPGDGGWPDYEEDVKSAFEDTSKQLADNAPPMEVPSKVDAASHGMRMLMEEHKQLDHDKVRLEETLGMTKETVSQLEAAQQIGQAQEKGIEDYVGVGDTLESNQGKLEKKSAEVEQGGVESSSAGGKLNGHVMDLVTGGIYSMFSLMDGIGRLAGKSSGGDEKMKNLEKLGTDVPEHGQIAKDFGASTKAEAKEWQTQTKEAKQAAETDKQEVTGAKDEMSSTHEEATSSVQSLEDQKEEVAAYEEELLGHRQKLVEEHTSASDQGREWVETHSGIREAGVEEITKLLEDVYDHRAQ